MTGPARPSTPGVKVPPPLLFLSGLGLAWLLESYVSRIRLAGEGATPRALEGVGLALVIAGLSLVMWGMITFARARTAIIPMFPASTIVDKGPYRFTRNPMYTGMATAYIGGAFLLNSVWALLLLPFVMLAIFHLVIRREERYLMSAFPEEYGSYCQRVRRWL